MNALKRIENIKNTVGDMNGKFICFINEREALIQNIKDQSIWQVPFIENENSFIFDGTKAQKLQAGRKSKNNPVNSYANRLQKNIRNLFKNNYEEAIADLKYTISTLPYIEQEEKITEICSSCKTILSDDPDNPAEKICLNSKCETNMELLDKASDGKPEAKDNTPVTEAMDKMAALFKDFAKVNYLFDEDGNINNIEQIKPVTEQDKMSLISDTKHFLKNVKSYQEFKTVLSKELSSEVVDTFFESFSWENEDFGPATARALTRTKQKHQDINIVETLNTIKNNIKSFYNEEPDVQKAAPWVYNLITPNDENKPVFLRFRTGAFTFDALKIISEEIDNALRSYRDLKPEELDKLGNFRTTVEYMLQTKQINDHVLANVINEFNELFVKTDDDYYHNQLGYRNRDEQFQGWVKGWGHGIDFNLADDSDELNTEG